MPSTPPKHVSESNQRVDTWLNSLPDRPLHHGTLGLQERGQMISRFCVLFHDRLDLWDSAATATKGARPVDRMAFNGVRGLEIVKGGFVLNNKGRRMGVHVDSNEQLHEWSGALLSALAPSNAEQKLSRPTSGKRTELKRL